MMNNKLQKLQIEPTEVMTGDRNSRKFLYYQQKLSMASAKRIDMIHS